MNNRSIERRKNPRAYIKSLALITPPATKRPVISGWIHNISLDGAGVKAKEPSTFGGAVQEGDEIHFKTQEDYFEFHGRGKVMWTSPQGDMMGIKFSQLGQGSGEALKELLDLFPSFSIGSHSP